MDDEQLSMTFGQPAAYVPQAVVSYLDGNRRTYELGPALLAREILT